MQMDEWLEETMQSLSIALDALENGDVPKENLYKLAPLFFSERQNIRRDSLIKEMIAVNEEQVQFELNIDANSIQNYKFHYVSCYLYCFVVAGKIDEFKYDDIMEYVNGQIDLF